MNKTNQRDFNCKEEELSVIAKFVAFSLKRDLGDFTAYSPLFTTNYVTDFESKITRISDLLEPKTETLAKTQITARYTATIHSLPDKVNRISGYIMLAKTGLTENSFGLKALRKSIDKTDIEGVMDNLHLVIANLISNKAALAPQGLTEEFITDLSTAWQSMSDDKQLQFEITTNRSKIVQNNLSLLNDLYSQVNEINKIGKILYKLSDKSRLDDYTFSSLLKKVRQVKKTTPTETQVTTN